MDHVGPTRPENEGFPCKNEVLLVLGTKEASGRALFSSLAARFSFILYIYKWLLNMRCRDGFACFTVAIGHDQGSKNTM